MVTETRHRSRAVVSGSPAWQGAQPAERQGGPSGLDAISHPPLQNTPPATHGGSKPCGCVTSGACTALLGTSLVTGQQTAHTRLETLPTYPFQAWQTYWKRLATLSLTWSFEIRSLFKQESSRYLCLTWPVTKPKLILCHHPLYAPSKAPKNDLLLTKTKFTLKGKRHAGHTPDAVTESFQEQPPARK